MSAFQQRASFRDPEQDTGLRPEDGRLLSEKIASEIRSAVLSGEMPAALSQVARHSWIVANVPGAGYLQRWELGGGGGGSVGCGWSGRCGAQAGGNVEDRAKCGDDTHPAMSLPCACRLL